MTGGKTIAILVLALLLGACSAPQPANQADESSNIFMPDGPPDVPAVANASALRAEDASAETRKLMRDAEAIGRRCRWGRLGPDGSYPACDRYSELQARLIKKGWCWDTGPPLEEERWVRCLDDPDYRDSPLNPYRTYDEAANVTP